MLLDSLPLGLEGEHMIMFTSCQSATGSCWRKCGTGCLPRIPQCWGPRNHWLPTILIWAIYWKDIGICHRIKRRAAGTHAAPRISVIRTRNRIPQKCSLFFYVTLSHPISNLCWSLLDFSLSSSKQVFSPWQEKRWVWEILVKHPHNSKERKGNYPPSLWLRLEESWGRPLIAPFRAHALLRLVMGPERLETKMVSAYVMCLSMIRIFWVW